MQPATLDRPPTADEAVKIRNHYRNNPEFFFKYFLGIEAWGKQVDIANGVRDHRITTVRSCHGAGKSFIAACIALWYISSHPDSIVITTAPTWRQVKDILWRNINTRYNKALIPLGGDVPNMVGWQVSPSWFAIGVSSKDPDKVQGYHAESGHLLVICDEAAGIEEIIHDGIENVLTGSKCRKLEIGNPTSSAGTFRDNHKPSAETHRLKISAWDTPNFKANNIASTDDLIEAMRQVKRGERELVEVSDFLISPIWVYERLKKWGRNSPMYMARVEAEFPDVGENTLIPLSQVEAACTNERLEKILGLKLNHPDIMTVGEAKFEKIETENDRIRQDALREYIAEQNTVRGVDVARMGSDSTVITPRWGRIFGPQKTSFKEDTMQVAGRVWPLIKNVPTDITTIDMIGLGVGTLDRLHELQRETGKNEFAQIMGINVALPASELPKELGEMLFANQRAEMYWTLRSWFEAGEVYIMPDEDGNEPEDLMAELSSIEYKFVGGKIYIEEKKEMKKRLHGKSPDHADSAMLTLVLAEVGDYNIEVTPDTIMPDPATTEEDDADWEPESRTDVGEDDNYARIDTEY